MKQTIRLNTSGWFWKCTSNTDMVPLIADLILKIIRKGVAAKWSFSNIALIRIQLMTSIDLGGFLKSPEKALMKMISKTIQSQSTAINYLRSLLKEI